MKSNSLGWKKKTKAEDYLTTDLSCVRSLNFHTKTKFIHAKEHSTNLSPSLYFYTIFFHIRKVHMISFSVSTLLNNNIQ